MLATNMKRRKASTFLIWTLMASTIQTSQPQSKDIQTTGLKALSFTVANIMQSSVALKAFSLLINIFFKVKQLDKVASSDAPIDFLYDLTKFPPTACMSKGPNFGCTALNF